MSNIQKILVVGNSRHHSTNLLMLGELLQVKYGNIEVIVVCDFRDITYYESKKKNESTIVIPFRFFYQNASHEKKGLSIEKTETNFTNKEFKSISSIIYNISSALALNSVAFKKILNFAKHTTIGCLILERKNLVFYKKLKVDAEILIDKIKPTVIFSFGDRHIDLEAPILMAAKQKNVKVIIPYTSYSDKFGLLAIRKLQRDLSIFKMPSIYKFYSILKLRNQIFDNYFYQTPSVLNALKKLHATSSNPWCIGNGNSDFVCVDSDFTYLRYIHEGVSENKIKVVGDLSYDTLVHAYQNRFSLRNAICNEYGIEKDKKIIILAMPQFAEQGLMDWEQHWDEILHICNALSSVNAVILISLHPRMNEADYYSLVRFSNIKISQKPLNQILPIADLFVSINSSTVIWSVLCGVPVCILNYFKLDISMFDHLKSIKYINNKSTLSKNINEVLEIKDEFDFKDDWSILSRKKVFDGNVMQRYYQLIIG